MPETAKFTSLGVGNGFPFCFSDSLQRVDVDEQDGGDDVWEDWITLGGYSKADAIAATVVTGKQIADSRNNAMKLFRGIYGLNGTADDNGDVITNVDPTNATGIGDYGVGQFFTTIDDPSSILEPRKRECVLFDSAFDLINNGPSSTLGQVYLFPVVKMFYNNSFVGFGVAGSMYFTATDSPTQGCWVEISSLFSDDIGRDYLPDFTFDYAEVSGMHFVANGAHTGGTFNLSTLTSTASFSGETKSCQITGINLYTYAP